MLENEVVIVIPTHNRQEYFERLFEYYGKWPCKFYLLDSTHKMLGSIYPDNFTYLHMPGKSFYYKINIALNIIRSRFVALCADDDVLSFDGLNKCVEELDNGTCGICNGKIVKFYHYEFRQSFYDSQSILKFRCYNNTSDSKRLLAEYSQVLWSVYEKNLIVEIFALLDLIKPKNDNYIELIIASVGQFRAGVTILPDLFLMREISPNLSWGANAVPLSSEMGSKSVIERHRIIDNVEKAVIGCPIRSDIGLYLEKNPINFLSFAKFFIYKILIKIFGSKWHGKRETNGYFKTPWC